MAHLAFMTCVATVDGIEMQKHERYKAKLAGTSAVTELQRCQS
jgi:hypothetical protein